MRKLLLGAFAALALISCQKDDVDSSLTVHRISAVESGLSAKGDNSISITLDGQTFDAKYIDTLKWPSELNGGDGSIIRTYAIPSNVGEYLEVEIVIQDLEPVGLAFKFYQPGGTYYSFYFDDAKPGESTTSWIVEASNGVVDENTSSITKYGTGDAVNGSIVLYVAKESDPTGGKTNKGATLPSLSRITFNGLGHYNNTISMEFEDLEYYNSSANGSEVVFSASDPYAGTFWITIKMNETGVPYGYVLNNTNGSNDYISGGNLEVVAAPGQVRLIGRAKKGIGTTQYWTQTMTFVMYQ